MDSPTEAQGPSSSQPAVVATSANNTNSPLVISDSGSSTEVDEDEDGDGGQTAARVPPRPPPTWAFSQRAVGSSTAANAAARGAPMRRRLRCAEKTCSEYHVIKYYERISCICVCSAGRA